MGYLEKKFRCGCCDAAVFENEISKGDQTLTVKSVSFQKRYRASDGEWKTTHSLDANDIPRAILVLQKAYEYMVLDDDSDMG